MPILVPIDFRYSIRGVIRSLPSGSRCLNLLQSLFPTPGWFIILRFYTNVLLNSWVDMLML